MSTIQTSIGLRFENFFSKLFPDLKNTTHSLNAPDFYNPEGNFWFETKTGNYQWGPRIKPYQIESFKSKQVIYVLGLHDLNQATKRINQKTERGRQSFLERNMNFLRIYFINQDLIEALWNKEGRINYKGTMTYCMIKESMLRNIIQERPFKRFGEQIPSAEEYYEYSRDDFVMTEPNSEEENIFGGILHRKKDSKILEYLARNEIELE
jgi:hypothetical protein